MAIQRLLQNSAFGPEQIAYIATAYEDALHELGLASRTDPITEIIAKKIIEIAQTGERDPLQIRGRAIAELGVRPFASDGHLTTTTTDPHREPSEIIEIDADWRCLQLLRGAVLDIQDLYERAKSTVQESQEFLRQIDDLHGAEIGPLLRK